MTATVRRSTAITLLLINTLMFGAAIPIVKWGAGEVNPFHFLFYRFLVAGILCLPIAWFVRKQLLKYPRALLQTMGIELLGTTLALGLLYVALRISTAIEVSLLATAGPVFITFSGLIFLREKVEDREWLGLLTSGTGVILLTLLPVLEMGWPMRIFSGVIVSVLMLAYHIVNTAYYTIAKPIYSKLPKIWVPVASSWVGAASFGLISTYMLLSTQQPVIPTFALELSQWQLCAVILYTAVGATLIGWTAYIKAQDLIEISEASLYTYLQPVVYIPLSAILLHERLEWTHVGSLGLVIIGVFIAEWRKKKRSKPKKR